MDEIVYIFLASSFASIELSLCYTRERFVFYSSFLFMGEIIQYLRLALFSLAAGTACLQWCMQAAGLFPSFHTVTFRQKPSATIPVCCMVLIPTP